MVDRWTVTGIIDRPQADFRPVENIVSRRDWKYTFGRAEYQNSSRAWRGGENDQVASRHIVQS